MFSRASPRNINLAMISSLSVSHTPNLQLRPKRTPGNRHAMVPTTWPVAGRKCSAFFTRAMHQTCIGSGAFVFTET